MWVQGGTHIPCRLHPGPARPVLSVTRGCSTGEGGGIRGYHVPSGLAAVSLSTAPGLRARTRGSTDQALPWLRALYVHAGAGGCVSILCLECLRFQKLSRKSGEAVWGDAVTLCCAQGPTGIMSCCSGRDLCARAPTFGVPALGEVLPQEGERVCSWLGFKDELWLTEVMWACGVA